MAIINLEMIGQMIAIHDRDCRSQDFEKVIMSDCGSQFGKMIVSDRGSQKKWSNPSLAIEPALRFVVYTWVNHITFSFVRYQSNILTKNSKISV